MAEVFAEIAERNECAPAQDVSNVATQVEDISALTHTLRTLFVKYGHALDDSSIREQLERVERWVDTYRLGLQAAQKLENEGAHILTDIRDRLKLAADDMLRMDDEGPAETPRDAERKPDALLKASRKVDAMIPLVDQAMQAPTPTDV